MNIKIHNPTKHDITLVCLILLGSLYLVQSVTSFEVRRKDLPRRESDTPEGESQLAITMIREEAEPFAQDDDDVGCLNVLQMKLTLSDPKHVQKTCPSVPRPLGTAVKHNIEYLLNWGWITKSHSSYASPVAC